MLSKKAHLIERNSGLNHGILLDIGTGTGYFSGFITDGTNNVTRWADRNAATIANDIQTTVEKISSHEA